MGSVVETLFEVQVSEYKYSVKMSSSLAYMAPSMTAMKYQRQPYVGRPLEPGQRYSVCREMESSIRGYKEINKDLVEARRNADYQDRVRRSTSVERAPPAAYYKSVVGTKSTRGGGAI